MSNSTYNNIADIHRALISAINFLEDAENQRNKAYAIVGPFNTGRYAENLRIYDNQVYYAQRQVYELQSKLEEARRSTNKRG